MTESIETVVIGAGAVGMAIARGLALAGHEVIALDKGERPGETSSRNSEVIHAGIYYPTGSLKARTCVAGKHLLYEYCRHKGVNHRRIGKVIVATDEEQRRGLRALEAHARANGVTDVEYLSPTELTEVEPAVRGEAALWSPSTGIIDGHAYLLALQADLERAGGVVALRSEFKEGTLGGGNGSAELLVASGGSALRLRAHLVVNAGGLHASRVARALRGFPAEHIPVTRFAKGNYFNYDGKSPFRHLVYPMPQAGGLGVHATLDLAGRLRFGPDVEWVEEIDYRLNAERIAAFYEAVRAYWPALPDGSLSPGHVGIRPKLVGPGAPAADFLIEGPAEHGVPGVINLFGIESPGLTASLALAEHVCALAEKNQ